LTDSHGLPGREWYQHMVYAPGFHTGYGVKTLPGIREAIEERRWDEANLKMRDYEATELRRGQPQLNVEDFVDMEAATIARLALAKGIPFYCLKAVSDDMDASLPDLNPFVSTDGRMRMAPFLAHVAVRPRSWAGLARLGRNSDLAAQHLADVIRAWLNEDFAAKGKG